MGNWVWARYCILWESLRTPANKTPSYQMQEIWICLVKNKVLVHENMGTALLLIFCNKILKIWSWLHETWWLWYLAWRFQLGAPEILWKSSLALDAKCQLCWTGAWWSCWLSFRMDMNSNWAAFVLGWISPEYVLFCDCCNLIIPEMVHLGLQITSLWNTYQLLFTQHGQTP